MLLSSKKKKIILIIITSILIFCVLVVLCLVLTPKITLKDDKKITIGYLEKYKEPGFVAKSMGKDISKNVKVAGKVNNKKIGEYEITYSIKRFIFKTEVTRIVKVVDDEKPVITLKGSESTKICPGTTYKDEGYEVNDNYDKNIEVKVEQEGNLITYSASDSSGNKTQVTRKLIEIDEEKPTIELSKGKLIYITTNSKYTEPGYKATDNCDGDLTSSVKVTGTVDTSRAGTYKISYSVIDKNGNETMVERSVVVQNNYSQSSSCDKNGVIYLTFDDGPNEYVTPKILDTLKKENVKATFFVTSAGPDYLIKRAYDEGHTIALHTSSHDYAKVYSSVEGYFNDLKTVSDRVLNITGKESKIIRFPGGSSNTISKKYSPGIMTKLSTEVVNRGYKYYDWNVSSEDAGSCAKTKSSDCVYQKVINNISKNKCNMVLMHDIKSYTADALPKIIEYGKKEGYEFKVIDEATPMVKQRINN